MRKIRSWLNLVGLATAVTFSTSCSAEPLDILEDIPVGLGYAAQDLCSRTLVSADNFSRVKRLYVEPKVPPLPYLWDIDRHRDEVQASVHIPLIADSRTAVFRPGLGCTVVASSAQAREVREQSLKPPRPQFAVFAPWPDGDLPAETWRLSSPERKILEQQSSALFTEPDDDPAARLNSIALLVAKDGKLVYERYGDDYHRDQPQLGWSMTKSLTALTWAIMASDGQFGADDPVGLAQWQGSEKAEITWRHLLNMAPGLEWNEGYGGQSDVSEMLFSQPDKGAWVAAKPLTAKPGTVFNYSTGFSTLTMYAMMQRLGSAQAMHDFYQQRLFEPLGIRHGLVEPDAIGTPGGGARGLLRPLDWLRLGQLVLDGGQWNSQTLIAPDIMTVLTTPSPASDQYAGAMWTREAPSIPDDLRPRLPENLRMFVGHLGQYTIILPDQQLVIVRLGASFARFSMERELFTMIAELVEAS